jgi:hypothetical protein
MSDLTLPIIGLTTLVGYFFSKQGNRRPQEQTVRNNVEQFEKPNGNNIYQSNKVNEVNQEMLSRSMANYEKAQNPAQTGVLPPLFNTYSAVGSDEMLSGETNFGLMGISAKQQSEINNVNRLVDVTSSKNTIEIEQRPMFKNSLFGGNERQDIEFTDFGVKVDSETSLLTGLPIDKQHGNMVPFFGSNVRQNVEQFSNEQILDRHTGNTSTFKHKREVGKLFNETPQDIHGTPIMTDLVQTDRYVPSLYRQNEKPFDDEKINAPVSGTVYNNIRPTFKSVNELRNANNTKETFQGRTIAGQLGAVRGAQSEFNKRRPETFYEKSFDHYFKTTGDFIAPGHRDDFSNIQPTHRKDYNIEYTGVASANKDIVKSRQRTRLGEGNEMITGDSIVQESRRNNFDNDYTRNVSGNKSTTDYGRSGITSYETERATTGIESHVLNANLSNSGVRTRLSDEPRQTMKQTTLVYDNSGNVKSQFDKGGINAFDSGITEFDAKTTHKETTLTNNYKGIMNKEDGMGYLVTKYAAKTTGKEIITNNSEYTGGAGKNVKNSSVYTTYDNPEKVRYAVHAENYKGNAGHASENMSRQNFDNAVVRDTKEIVSSGSRPSGPQNFQISSGKTSFGDVKITSNMMLKEREADREHFNTNTQQILPSKNSLGVQTTTRFDNGKEDTIYMDRLQPELVINQHNQNPFSLYGTGKNQ